MQDQAHWMPFMGNLQPGPDCKSTLGVSFPIPLIFRGRLPPAMEVLLAQEPFVIRALLDQARCSPSPVSSSHRCPKGKPGGRIRAQEPRSPSVVSRNCCLQPWRHRMGIGAGRQEETRPQTTSASPLFPLQEVMMSHHSCDVTGNGAARGGEGFSEDWPPEGGVVVFLSLPRASEGRSHGASSSAFTPWQHPLPFPCTRYLVPKWPVPEASTASHTPTDGP